MGSCRCEREPRWGGPAAASELGEVGAWTCCECGEEKPAALKPRQRGKKPCCPECANLIKRMYLAATDAESKRGLTELRKNKELWRVELARRKASHSVGKHQRQDLQRYLTAFSAFARSGAQRLPEDVAGLP